MVASKFLNDEGEEGEVFNFEWAQSGDLSIMEMNELEKDFLNAIVRELYDRTPFYYNLLANFTDSRMNFLNHLGLDGFR